MLQYILDHLMEIGAIVGGLALLLTAIAKLTPTTVDDKIAAVLRTIAGLFRGGSAPSEPDPEPRPEPEAFEPRPARGEDTDAPFRERADR